MARYVVASRRFGGNPSRRLIFAFLALAALGALWSRVNGPWQALILVLVPVSFAWAWFRRDGTELELGPSASAVDLYAEVITPSLFFPQTSGRVRLFVDEGTIAIRSVSFGTTIPGWLGFDRLTYTFRAADCEVGRPLMGASSFFASHGKASIVLRGPGRRGEVELALTRPSGVTLEDVQRALIRAGARPAEVQLEEDARPGPVIQPEPASQGRLPITPNASWSSTGTGEQPPYWPPPPDWVKAHEAPAGPEI